MTSVYDLTSVASQVVLSRLIKYAKSEKESAKLKLLATNAEVYNKWVDTQKGSFVDTLNEFKSVRLNLEQAYQTFDMTKLRWLGKIKYF